MPDGIREKAVRGLFSDKLVLTTSNGFYFNVESEKAVIRWCCNVHGCF